MPSSASHGNNWYRPSFPTRRSSDLEGPTATPAGPIGTSAAMPSQFELIDDQVMPVRGFGTYSFDMQGIGERLAAGEQLQLVIYGYQDRKSTRLNSSHTVISYAVFCFPRQQLVSTFFPYTTLFRSGRTNRDPCRPDRHQRRDAFAVRTHR